MVIHATVKLRPRGTPSEGSIPDDSRSLGIAGIVIRSLPGAFDNYVKILKISEILMASFWSAMVLVKITLGALV
jgi:hypothetical protein